MGDCAAKCSATGSRLAGIHTKFQYNCVIAAVGHGTTLWTAMTVNNGRIWENYGKQWLKSFARKRSSPYTEKGQVGPQGTLIWPKNPTRETEPIYLHDGFYVLSTNDYSAVSKCLCHAGELKFTSIWCKFVKRFKGGPTEFHASVDPDIFPFCRKCPEHFSTLAMSEVVFLLPGIGGAEKSVDSCCEGTLFRESASLHGLLRSCTQVLVCRRVPK